MYTVTVVLEHPVHAELSNVIFQERFDQDYPALRCYHDLAQIYTEGHYSVCLDRKYDFSLERHIDAIKFVRDEGESGV